MSMHIIFMLLCLGYLLLVGYLYVFQRRFIYEPGKEIGPPEQYGLSGFSEHLVVTPDHECIQLWYRPAAPGFPVIAYTHGNSYNLADRAPVFAALADKGFGILGVGYRGYGKSSGSPDEEGLYIDARTGMNFLIEQMHIQAGRILLFGESLGTGVAIQMGTEYKAAGIVLQSPYTSVAKRAAEMYFYVPVRYLIKDKFDSLSKMRKLKMPLLLFHGERDGTIPIRQGKAIFEAAPGPKQSYFFPEVAHYDFDPAVISQHVLEFAQAQKLIMSS